MSSRTGYVYKNGELDETSPFMSKNQSISNEGDTNYTNSHDLFNNVPCNQLRTSSRKSNRLKGHSKDNNNLLEMLRSSVQPPYPVVVEKYDFNEEYGNKSH